MNIKSSHEGLIMNGKDSSSVGNQQSIMDSYNVYLAVHNNLFQILTLTLIYAF